MEILNQITLKMVLSVIAGGALGYGYYRFIGCKSGTCPIVQNPFLSILYGAVLGYIFAL